MSDPDRRHPEHAGRGVSPREPSRLGEEPPEYDVGEGIREAPRDARAAYVVGGINVDQLALALAPALAEHLKPRAPDLPPFGQLIDEWLEYIRTKRVEPANEERLARRLAPLRSTTEATLTAGAVAELLEQQADIGASMRNKVRGVGRMVVDWAASHQRWNRPNPFALVKREKEGRRKYELLTLADLARVQEHLRVDRQRLFRVALHTGMRPGELMGLRIEDVDFPNGVIHVRVSRDRDTTKTGEPRDIPIHPAIETDLLDACVESKGELVFGHRLDGSLESQNTKLTRILRTAMAKADVGVLGADWKCRRQGCGHVETHLGPIDRRRRRYCPRCDFRLLAVPLIREVRWYDLRHMSATFHHDAGADRVCVALALGHSLEGTTEEIYTHPSMEKMRVELTRWSLRRPSPQR